MRLGRDLHAEMAFIHANRAMGDQRIIGIDIERIGFQRIEFDHRATPHAQQMVDRHRRCAKFNRDIHFNVVEGAHRYVQNSGTQHEAARSSGANSLAIMVMEALISNELVCGNSNKLARSDGQPVQWIISEAQVPYPLALQAMRDRAAAIAAGEAQEAVWLLEHPPLYTAGTSAVPGDLLTDTLPVYDAGRGGQYTYHGPGQRVAYVMLDLTRRGRDIRCLVQGLESWVIDTLAAHNIVGERRAGRIGVWVRRPDKGPQQEDKIAAIGVRVSKWVTFHGISLNVMPDLSHYGGIVPCGITDQGVTSFEDLGQLVSMPEVDTSLRAAFERQFGPTTPTGYEGLVSIARHAQVAGQ